MLAAAAGAGGAPLTCRCSPPAVRPGPNRPGPGPAHSPGAGAPDSGHSGPATGGHGWRGHTGKRQVQGSQGAGGAPGVSTPTTCRSRRVGRGAVGPGGGGGSVGGRWAHRTPSAARAHVRKGPMCHPGAPECQVTAQQQRRLPRLARDRNRLHFPGQSQRHSGFSLGFSLGKGGSEPRETLRLGAGLLEPRPASGPRWTQGPSHRLEEEAGGVPGAPRGGGGRPEPWPRPAQRPSLERGLPLWAVWTRQAWEACHWGWSPCSRETPPPPPAPASRRVCRRGHEAQGTALGPAGIGRD